MPSESPVRKAGIACGLKDGAIAQDGRSLLASDSKTGLCVADELGADFDLRMALDVSPSSGEQSWSTGRGDGSVRWSRAGEYAFFAFAEPGAKLPEIEDARKKAGTWITLLCSGKGTEEREFLIPLDYEMRPDYSAVWGLRLKCEAPIDGPQTMSVVTAFQQAAVKKAKAVGYGTSDVDEELLLNLYVYCASNDPTDTYVSADHTLSSVQMPEVKAWMGFCPTHPQAKTWKAKIAAGEKELKAEAAGEILYDGTYAVPREMKPGTYVVRDVENCYWETRNSSGRIINNDFIVAAPRVVVTVPKSAAAFTVRSCGKWVKR